MSIASKAEEQQSSTKETVCMSDVPSEDMPFSNGFRQQLCQADDEPGSLTDMESSTERSEKVPKSSTIGQTYLIKPTLDDFLDTGISYKTCATAAAISAINSSKNRTENPIYPPMRRYNGNHFSEAVSNGLVQSPLSEKTKSIGKIPVVSSSEKSRDAEKAPGSSSAPTGLLSLYIRNVLLPAIFPELPVDSPVSKVDDTPMVATENIKIPSFQQDGEKSTKEGMSTHSGFVKPEALHGGGTIDGPSTPWKSLFSNYPLPPGSLPKTNSGETPKTFCQALEMPILTDMNSNKSLTELLSNLENWGIRGLDKAINMPKADVGSHFRKDVHYGFDLMKEMVARIRTLIAAMNHLPDFDLQGGTNRVRGDIISTGLEVWLTINDLELSAIKAINDMATNPDNVIMDLYIKVVNNFTLLNKEIEDFHANIRVFCSELGKFL